MRLLVQDVAGEVLANSDYVKDNQG